MKNLFGFVHNTKYKSFYVTPMLFQRKTTTINVNLHFLTVVYYFCTVYSQQWMVNMHLIRIYYKNILHWITLTAYLLDVSIAILYEIYMTHLCVCLFVDFGCFCAFCQNQNIESTIKLNEMKWNARLSIVHRIFLQ